MRLYLDHYERTQVGNYAAALAKAAAAFSAADPGRMAALAGCELDGPGRLLVPCLGHLLEVEHPAARVRFAGTSFEPNVSLLIVVLNHLARADGAPVEDRVIPYRELPGGDVFWGAFARYAIAPLVENFGTRPGRLIQAAQPLGGRSIQTRADASVRLPFFPHLPLVVQVSAADDEVPGAANILFDASAPHYIHTEDAAVVGSYAGRLLVALDRGTAPADLAGRGVV